MSLTKKAIGGVKWTSIAAMISASVQLLQVAVLARFLDKKDFGLMAIAIFVIGISQIFIDMGISNSIIHKQKVNKYQLSSLFWLNIIIGIIVFVLLYACAPLISEFYKEPQLIGVLRWVGFTFLIIPWGQQYESLLQKELQFKSLSIRDIIGKIAGLFISIYLAYFHFGVYALVYANISTAVISTALLLFYGLKEYRPMLLISFRSLKGKGFFSFGLFQMGEKIINYFNSQFDTLLIGKLLGMEALGLYNIAKTLAFKPYQIINPIITKVAFPLLSKVQHDIPKLKNVYLNIVNILSLINAPIYAMFIIAAKPLIIIIFGKEWASAALFLQLLSVTALLNSIGNPIGSLQLARGRADLGFYWNVGMFVFLPVTIWFGSFYGLFGVALALAIFKIASLIPVWRFFVRPLCNATFFEFNISYLRPILMSTVCGLIAYATSFLFHSVYLQVIVPGLVLVVTYASVNMVFNKADSKRLLLMIKPS